MFFFAAYEEREGIDLRRDLFLLDSCVSLECEENRRNTLNLVSKD